MNDLRHISSQELAEFIQKVEQKKFRVQQIETWLWQKGVRSISEMSNLPTVLRQQLQSHFSFQQATIVQQIQSNDGTTKYIFALHDEKQVEGVLIPTEKRVTACLSSQVGCALKCAFCATGTMGFVRNLHYSEIFDQFILLNNKAQEIYKQKITNIVLMGMGEPLLNYDNVMRAIDIIIRPDGQNFSPSRITLSTVGISQGIKRLADDHFKPDIALSLHCADEIKRKQRMPITEYQTFEMLQDSLIYLYQKTGKRITIEYLMLRNWNDSIADAKKLFHFCRPFPVKINLIEYNPTDSTYEKSSPEAMQQFIDFLESKNMIVNVRHSRGRDIEAACGQLVRKKQINDATTV